MVFAFGLHKIDAYRWNPRPRRNRSRRRRSNPAQAILTLFDEDLGKLETLEKTARRSDLSDPERRIVDDGMHAEQRELAIWDARDALRAGEPGGRRACLRVLRTKGLGFRARRNALAPVVAPRAAGRALERRDRAGVEITAGLRIGGRSSLE